MSASPISCLVPQRFEFVPEMDEFLELFPHRGSYLWSNHPAPNERPQWNTETRHLLSDRLIKQGAYLYGVRFGSHTNYIMLDIDRKSIYHPYRDMFAVKRILSALEPLGLVRFVAVSSSYSGGIHLYFPFVMAMPSWAIAKAVSLLLQNAGFKIDRGQLELFPNARLSWGADYNGHRLPLQTGSYLLDDDWQPTHSSHAEFVHQWRLADFANSVTLPDIEQIIKQYDRRPYRRLKGLAQKFLNDLNAEIEVGWTGFGQTNRLLGKIAQREYIFYHALYGGEPLQGDRLAARIYEVAESLPGFEEWCRHKHEMVRLCRFWGRSVELSNYYPYGGNLSTEQPSVEQTWNQQQSEQARKRIQLAVAQLIDAGTLAAKTRERMLQIRNIAKVSSDTLYKNKDLWHGENDLKPAPNGVIHPDQQKKGDLRSLKPAPNGVIHPIGTNKLSPTSVPAPSEPSTDGTTDCSEGEREGVFHSSENEQRFQSAADLVALLRTIEQQGRSRRIKQAIELGDSPPDERWFQPVLVPIVPDEQWRS